MSIRENRFARPAAVAAILAVAIATGACSKKEAADTPPPPPATSTAPAPDMSVVKVADVDVGHSVGADKKVTAKAMETLYERITHNLRPQSHPQAKS